MEHRGLEEMQERTGGTEHKAAASVAGEKQGMEPEKQLLQPR